jgi:WD40 repeat protein
MGALGVRLRSAVVAVCIVALMAVAPSAHAALPGANGKIAFSSFRDGNAEIYTMNADGTGQTNITNNAALDLDPAWSPNGSRIAFRHLDGNAEIYTMNADGTGQTNITNNPASDYEPAWSPNGNKIAFWSNRDGNNEIYTMNTDGSGVARITNNAGGGREEGPTWSPDGTKIAFRSYRDGNAEIYTMNADGTGPTRVTNNPAVDEEPAWSPDGTKIAFRSERDGNAQIYTMNTDGSAVTNLSNNPGVDIQPDWQRPINPYPRPKGATPLSVSLVPAFTPCASPNKVHGAPLDFGSCGPPVQTSGQLTVGTPEANGQAEQSVGSVTLKAVLGNPATPADEADIRIDTALTDVRRKTGLADYDGELSSVLHVRLTDRLSAVSQTVQDFAFNVTVPCTGTVDTTIGSNCSLTTTADTVVPGAVPESKRSIWGLDRVEVYDGGPDGRASTTADNTLFMDEGLFVP